MSTAFADRETTGLYTIYTFFTAYCPEALAEGSDQSEFNSFVHGLG